MNSRLAASKGKSVPKSLSKAPKSHKAIREKVFSKGHFHSPVEVRVICLDKPKPCFIQQNSSIHFSCFCLGDQPTRARVTFSQWPGEQDEWLIYNL